MTTPTPDRRGPIVRLRPGGANPSAANRLRRRVISNADGGFAATPWLREWHLQSARERRVAWIELVDWVIWLHDRYELGVENRLPACWTRHPGLVEELFALKAWRHNIYAAPEPNGQAARYWHGELRQVLHAATTQYAAGCRAGHRDAPTIAADSTLRTTWLAADPLTGVPAQLLTPQPDRADRELVNDTIIRDALQRGTASTLSQQIAEFIRYDGSWWTTDPAHRGWRRVTDPIFAADLDHAAARMAVADAAVQKRRHTNKPANQATNRSTDQER